jgi:hypothetical protein
MAAIAGSDTILLAPGKPYSESPGEGGIEILFSNVRLVPASADWDRLEFSYGLYIGDSHNSRELGTAGKPFAAADYVFFRNGREARGRITKVSSLSGEVSASQVEEDKNPPMLRRTY